MKVPNGFAITALAYSAFIKANNLEGQIRDLLGGLDTQDSQSLRKRGSLIRQSILEATLPEELQKEILASYQKLASETSDQIGVAVRSSATAEDLPDASFAGQQETYLNVRGDTALLESVSDVSRLSLLIGRSPTAMTNPLILSRSLFPLVFSGWFALTWLRRASCSRSIPRLASGTWW